MQNYEDVLKFVEEENIRFIRLAFFDVFGNQKNIAIMPGNSSARSGTVFPLTRPRSRGSGKRSEATCS